jgi:hypothetical protein
VTTAIAGLASTLEGIAAIKRPLESLLGDGNPLLERDGPVVGAAGALLRADAAYGQALDAFSALAAATPADPGLRLCRHGATAPPTTCSRAPT